MTTVIDFDAFRAEQKKEPVHLKLGGKIYDLPPSLPASVAIDAIRLKSRMGDEDDVPVEEIDRIGAAMFGPSVWQAILIEHSLTVDEMGDLFKKVLSQYTGTSGDPLAAAEG